jgi:hypothetical protein
MALWAMHAEQLLSIFVSFASLHCGTHARLLKVHRTGQGKCILNKLLNC